jgi:hypothetical protein
MVRVAKNGEPVKRIYGFRAVAVFDEAQTEGEALVSYPWAISPI